MARLHARQLDGPLGRLCAARRRGDWEETGKETLAKRRPSDILPEMPYRTGDEEVEGQEI